ncbi:hypothetical protein MN608_08396 [Microdochium nivale]|nr:hypothetical protein MN608_08396 [Microdochium nivale]
MDFLRSYSAHVLLSDGYSFRDDSPFTNIDPRAFYAAVQKLRQIFSARRALPTDVDEWEQNLMHTLVDMLSDFHEESAKCLAKVLGTELVCAFGVSVTQKDRNGSSAFEQFLCSLWRTADVTDFMVASIEEELVFKVLPFLGGLRIHNFREISAKKPVLYEKMNVDPLSKAILQKNPEKVTQIHNFIETPLFPP